MAKTTVRRPRSASKRTTATKMPGRPRVAKGGTKRPTWTFMLYLAGDNNLDDEMVWTLKEIFRVGVPTGVQVTARLDTSARRGIRVFQPSTTLDTDGSFRSSTLAKTPRRIPGTQTRSSSSWWTASTRLPRITTR
jgi:hypothetical protein